ncbi:alanine racemase [Algihabitans albus]|uniref:alanine racemase n=1 Tax=Algihabitans albus TaxID=2164067 RepID=UPI000E5D959D|nr:alanine racemase [Algihabitans albus]
MPSYTVSDPAARAGAILEIDLPALAANWQRLAAETAPAEAAAVVKADAYGLGIAQAAPALWAAGARAFFVAQLDEALALRSILPQATVYVLNGLMAGAEADYLARDLCPVLNSLEDLTRWKQISRERKRAAALQIDTGMSRLGLDARDLETLATEGSRAERVPISYLMSHLASADDPTSQQSADQLAEFLAARQRLSPRLGAARASLANSAGIFLGRDYHFDLVRPGSALYGINPKPGQPNPMRQVVRLKGKILQIREIDAPRGVGYGATWRAQGPTRIATVALGYADGYLRSLSNSGQALVGGHNVPVVGRVSMDLITLDVTAVPEAAVRSGAYAELLGPDLTADAVGQAAGTIGYEILTSLGHRYHRVYLEAAA